MPPEFSKFAMRRFTRGSGLKRATLIGLAAGTMLVSTAAAQNVSFGPRPYFLVDQMQSGALKQELLACADNTPQKSSWSIGHRGAPLQFPEHTRESYIAAARMGAGIMECDVTFTRDRQLVCRHSQNDLHRTTNILVTPLADRCVKKFTPAAEKNGKASAECRTSEITLAQFKTLNGKMDAADEKATTAAEYLNGTAPWRTDLYAGSATLQSHRDYIALGKSLGVRFTPELKTPVVRMPFEGDYTVEDFAQQMIDEYREAGVDPVDVFAQSFDLDVILYWIANEPEFGRQAVFLDNSYQDKSWLPDKPSTWRHSMVELKAMGINYLAPPMWVLVTEKEGRIVPSVYTREAAGAGLRLITWTAERSGLLVDGGGWYYRSITGQIDNEGDVFRLLHVLNKDIGVVGVFSDWPATTTFYANCFNLD